MSTLENKISNILLKLKTKYSKELKKKTSSFISLGLQYDLTIRAESTCKELNIEDLLYQIVDIEDPIAVVGGPGAGKSTLLLKFANLLLESESFREKYIPIFIHCGLNTSTNLKDLVHLSGFTEEEKEILWQSGRLYIIFDGINEVSGVSVGDFFKKILALSEEYPCKFILSCRAMEFPRFANKHCEKYSVLPVTDKQVEQKLKNDLGEELGGIYYNDLNHSSQNYLVEICRNPLLLSLVSKIIEENLLESGSFDLKDLRTKKDVYKHFCDLLNDHETSKKEDSNYKKFNIIREEVIRTLAFYMQATSQVYIDNSRLLDIIRDMPYEENRSEDLIRNLQRKSSDDLWYQLIVNDIKKSSFFNGFEQFGKEYFAFIHQSFQEYFAGVYLSIHAESPKFTTYLLGWEESPYNRELSENNMQIRTKRNWGALEFAIDADSGDKIISYIMKYAREKEDSDALVLAAKCILNSNKKNTHFVDDCCIWMLEAFKYWALPYKYDLIYAANELLPYVSNDFPNRLAKDIEYFGEKYTGGYIATEYPESFDFDHLKSIITDDSDVKHQMNAIYSLGERSWNENLSNEVLQYLFSLICSDNTKIKEQVVKALKSFLENNKRTSLSERQLRILRELISDKKQSSRIRTYALNTIAEIGDKHSIQTVMDYLKDKDNPYRDSASWSLQELVKGQQEPYTLEFMQNFYYRCLVSETADQTGMYSKGNLVYTLSKLKANTYVQNLKQWLRNEIEPYVQEDGINAIGILAGNDEISFIKEYIFSSDPVIRSKAYSSLRDLNYHFSTNEIEAIKNDSYSIVNYIFEDFLDNPENDVNKLMRFSPDNNCVGSTQQNFENVETVINVQK